MDESAHTHRQQHEKSGDLLPVREVIHFGNAQNVGARAVEVELTNPKFLQKLVEYFFKLECEFGVSLVAAHTSDLAVDIAFSQIFFGAQARNSLST